MDDQEENESIFNPKRLRLRGVFENQVKTIFETIRISRMEVMNLKRVYNDIHETFDEIWEGCIIKPFGSVRTGLALKSSDVDCYIDVRRNEDPIQCIKKSVYFLNFSMQFQVSYRAIHTKIPYMRIIHMETETYCDISFSGPIAVEDGALFKYLLDIYNTRSLAVLVKYWSKVNKIAGTPLLSNIALTILLIVFLQTENILPSIARLQENVTPIMVDGWNTAFERIKWQPRTFKSVYQLLGEFFEFYSDFNFADFVVSPYLGGFVERQSFSNINTVPAEFVMYRLRNAVCGARVMRGCIHDKKCWLCVQLPFEHSENIAKDVKPSLALRIKRCFRTAAESYRNYPKSEFLKHILNVYENTSVYEPLPQVFATPRFTPVCYTAEPKGTQHTTLSSLQIICILLFYLLLYLFYCKLQSNS